MNIDGKNIILTGASSGIGLELLNLLMKYNNVKIIAVARHIEAIPDKDGIVFSFSTDLNDSKNIDALFEYSEKTIGHIDIFIANAGYAYMERFDCADWKHIENIFALNVFSPIYSLQKLSQIKSDQDRYLVCTSSAVASVPLPYYSLYCSTKAAISQFMKTYRYEKSDDLKVMTVYPVATRTSFFKKAAIRKQPPIPFFSQNAETVAKAIVRGIELNRVKVYPSFLFRIFEIIGSIFPFVFKIYSLNEKRKVNKMFNLWFKYLTIYRS